MEQLPGPDRRLEDGLDDARYTLTEHLTELRGRLLWSFVAIVLTTLGALGFAPELLEYSIEPLAKVLRDRNRVDTVLVYKEPERRAALERALQGQERVRFLGTHTSVVEAAEFVRARSGGKKPVDLLFVSSEAIERDGPLVSEALDGIEPAPFVVYLVSSARDPAVELLQLEGAVVILEPLRASVLGRVVRRAAGASGKSASVDKLVALSPLDPFFAYLKISLVVGLFLACPVWLYQGWRFVAPGLYAKEKRVVLPAVLGASALFTAGGLFAYSVMFPFMFDVILNQMMPASLAGSFTVDNYLTLLLGITVAFGVVFEVPLVIALLAMMGIVSPVGLRRVRKYAIVASFVFSAMLMPGDPGSLLMMAIPLCLFYEVGILLAAFLTKKREARLAAEAVDSG